MVLVAFIADANARCHCQDEAVLGFIRDAMNNASAGSIFQHRMRNLEIVLATGTD
jgi:hypothetical protein